MTRPPQGVRLRATAGSLRDQQSVDDAIVDRRGGLPPRAPADRYADALGLVPGGAPIECVRVRRPGRTPVLAVPEELIVRARHADDAVRVATAAGWTSTARVIPGLDDRLCQLLFDQAISIEALLGLARRLNATGVRASVSHVPPLRVVIKGECGPEVVTEHPSSRATVDIEDHPHVAVIDCGVNVGEDDGVTGERTDGWLDGVGDPDATTSAQDPLDVFPLPDGNKLLDLAAGHGTFVAGIVRQVAPSARVSMIRALDSDGVGSEVTVAQAMVRAAASGADVINLSLGVQTVDDRPLLAVAVALEIIGERQPETLVVAAAGNYGNHTRCFPAAQEGVVSVGSLDPRRRPAAWSTRGEWVACSTVGEDIVSTFVNGTSPDGDRDDHGRPEPDGEPDSSWSTTNPWARWSGTSFSAPQVAGAIARRMAESTGLTPREALTALIDAESTDEHPTMGHRLSIAPFTPA